MAFAGNCSVKITLDYEHWSCVIPLNILFAEEAGIVLEVSQTDISQVMDAYSQSRVPCLTIGESSTGGAQHKVSLDVFLSGPGAV